MILFLQIVYAEERVEVHRSRCLLSLYLGGWSYVCLFCCLTYTYFFYNDTCVRLRRKQNLFFSYVLPKLSKETKWHISPRTCYLTSNNHLFPLKIISLIHCSSLEYSSPILFMGHLSGWRLSHFSKGSYSLFLCNKLSQSPGIKSNHSKLRSVGGRGQVNAQLCMIWINS